MSFAAARPNNPPFPPLIKNIVKTIHSLPFVVALSAAVIVLSGCAKTDTVQSVAQDTAATAKDVAVDVKTTAVDSWDNIKDYSYEKREDFAAGLDRMSDKRDAELRSMNAKLAGLPDDTAKARDHAVKDFNEARASLKTHLTDLRASSADTWAAAKEKTAESWQRVQTAYDKATSSPKT
jgi:hypothetical protein